MSSTRRTTLLALDGNSLAHRAFHAYSASNMTTSDDRPIWAVYGFFALLAGICDKVRPDALVIGFDGADNVRKQRYPAYKATRSEKAPELIEQMDRIAEVARQIGLVVDQPRGWEADDVVASWAHTAEQAGWQTIVATSDRDAFSLITERCAVMRLKSGLDNAVFYTPQRLEAEYGVRPEQYLDFAAVRGDTSDNLPGVNGIGEKTATKLLTALNSVEAALASPSQCKQAIGDAMAGRLVADQDNYRRNVELMAQRRDLPVDLEASRLARIDADVVVEVLHATELPNLVERVAQAFTGTSGRRAQRPQGQPLPPPPQDEKLAADADGRRRSRSATPSRGHGVADERLVAAPARMRRPENLPVIVGP